MKVAKSVLVLSLTVSMASLQARPHSNHYYGPHHGGYYGGHHGGYYGGHHEVHHYHHNDHHSGGHLSDGEAIAIGAVGAAVLIGAAASSDVTCSPKTIEKNLNTVDGKLVKLSQNELKDRGLFVQKVEDMQSMSATQKVDEAFRLVGIENPRNAKEIMEVVYAREPSKKSIERVSESLKLSAKESRLVIQSVTSALKAR